METHVATRKPHRCSLCCRRIPIGSRYFSAGDGEVREHTNCLDFEAEPLLVDGFNQNRKLGEVKYYYEDHT